MTKIFTLLIAVIGMLAISVNAQKQNLLLNSQFDFHAFDNHRLGHSISFKANNVAFWNSDGSQNVTVYRESHIDRKYLKTVHQKFHPRA